VAHRNIEQLIVNPVSRENLMYILYFDMNSFNSFF